MMKSTQFIILLGSWAAMVTAIWSLFERCEKVVRPETKKMFSDWLNNYKIDNSFITCINTFGAMFDSFFGNKHLSLKCFLSSCFASMVFLIILTLLWASIYPNYFIDYFVPIDIISGKRAISREPFITVLLIGIILNMIPDYISLLKTRIIIQLTKRYNILFDIIILMILDPLFSTFIALLFFLITFQLRTDYFTYRFEIPILLPGLIIKYLKEAFLFEADSNMPPLGIFFYSTFLTSIWLWLHCIASMISKGTYQFNLGLKWLKMNLDVDNSPISSMGIISTIIITLGYIIIPIIFKLF